MKRLAVFCDGTWNDLRMPELTNVARLAKCVKDCAADGTPQVVFYDTGVGVASRVSRAADFLVRMVGGAFGRGLNDKVETAYRFLVLNYEPGDEIYVFGFSRGAYTARSLCGLIRKCGIVRRSQLHKVPDAIALYRNHDCAPSEVSQFRLDYAHGWPPAPVSMETDHAPIHPIATGKEDLPHADREKVWPGRYRFSRDAPQDHASWRIYKMMYLGVWDTVGALGVPASYPWLAKVVNAKYRFHDPRASSLITSIRHAVAIDEDRRSFDVTPVENVADLNAEWAAATAADVATPYDQRPYQQRWFPGDHGAVGGGNAEPGLSSSALLWVAEGARLRGLEFNTGQKSELAAAAALANPLANWRVEKNAKPGQPVRIKPDWKFDVLGIFGGYGDRKGPATREELHPTAEERLQRQPSYRPAPLSALTNQTAPPLAYRWIGAVLEPVVLVLLVVTIVALLVIVGLILVNGVPAAFGALRDWLAAACAAIRR